MKKLKHFLSLWDGVWSIPLSIFIFFAIGFIGQSFFGQVVGFYDPSIWQTVFLAIGIMLAFNFAAWLGLWFNFRGVFRYFVGQKKEDGSITNRSKEDAKNLTPWQRLLISLLLYLFYMLLLVLVLRLLIK
jgi:hypothetical protein